jgi:hypothetical protein
MNEMTTTEPTPGAEPEATQLPPAPEPYEQPPMPALPSPRPSYEKSPGLAAFLSFVPGLGYLYLGAYQRAVMIFATVLLTIYLLPMPVNVFAPIFVWFYGMFDSYRLGQIANLGGEEPMSMPKGSKQGSIAFGVFLAVVGALLTVNNFYPIDLDWIQDWWPMILFVIGVWLIISAVRERQSVRDSLDDDF